MADLRSAVCSIHRNLHATILAIFHAGYESLLDSQGLATASLLSGCIIGKSSCLSAAVCSACKDVATAALLNSASDVVAQVSEMQRQKADS